MYLKIGIEHIADPKGYDHILFIITLCAIYKPTDVKKVLILATAFTLGHSITLVLSAMNTVSLPSFYVEILIPVTILLTAVYNVRYYSSPIMASKVDVSYIMAIVFGFIHGLGFSSFFKSIMGGSNVALVPLFSFNMGIELGQILIVIMFMFLLYLFTSFFKIIHREWNIFINGISFGISFIMIMERIFNQ